MRTKKPTKLKFPTRRNEDRGCKRKKEGEEIVHVGIYCDRCNLTIKGIRFKCGNCPDFNVCVKCEAFEDNHDSSHVFLKLPRPAPLAGKVGVENVPLLREVIYKEISDLVLKDKEIAKVVCQKDIPILSTGTVDGGHVIVQVRRGYSAMETLNAVPGLETDPARRLKGHGENINCELPKLSPMTETSSFVRAMDGTSDEPMTTDVFPCPKCNLAFSKDALLERHLHRHHHAEYVRRRREASEIPIHEGDGEKLPTAIDVSLNGCCDDAIRKDKKLNSDSICDPSGTDRQKLCNVCGETFGRCDSLHRHMRIHTGEKPYKCNMCGKTFRLSGHLKTHMKIHNGVKSHKCTICDKQFRDSCNLQKHLRIHNGEKPYKCTVCSQVFNRSGSLHSHRRIHYGDKPYRCTVCKRSFGQSGNLQAHMRIHNGEKPYKCAMCGKMFTQSSSMRTHMRIHNGDKPYTCIVCNKSFSDNGGLRKHLRIHNGEKPYLCTLCDKAFGQSGNLQAHMRIHNGEKPYKCKVCDKAFVQSGHMQKHMTVHNREKIHQYKLDR